MKGFSSVFSQSSLVPLAKIANAPSRSLRLLWAVFTATMFVGLCSCITLVVIQYCRHQTVFQLDYSGRHVIYDQIPGLTLCPQTQEAKRLFNLAVNMNTNKHSSPWLNKDALDRFRQIAQQRKSNMSFEVLTHRMPPGQLHWDTVKSALSPLYGMLHNFSVRFVMQPSQMSNSYRLTVMEQVPNPKHLLCTTFELRSHNPSVSRWSYLEMHLNQSATPAGSELFTSFILITHERGELPFSAYDRHIQTSLLPGSDVSVYFSKSVTARLNTARNPCHVGPGVNLIHAYSESAQVEQEAETMDSFGVASETKPSKLDTEAVWKLDFLDQLRMNRSIRTQTADSSVDVNLLKGSTVRLFGTSFLYSRESCGWFECSRKVRQVCNCSSIVELWSYKMQGCEHVEACERAECQVKQISYKTCPLACVVAKFVKHNTITETGPETNLAPGTIRVKLVRSEAVQVATEEEIFSLAKLFSEVGGLCSLFIGFSCIFLFELVEAIILTYKNGKPIKKNEQSKEKMMRNCDNRTNRLNLCDLNDTTRVVENPNVDRYADTRPFIDIHEKMEVLKGNKMPVNGTRLGASSSIKLLTNYMEEDEQPMTDGAKEPVSCFGQYQLTWEGETLVIPVCFAPGGLLEIRHRYSPKRGRMNENVISNCTSKPLELKELTKDDLLQLLRQNRVKLRMC